MPARKDLECHISTNKALNAVTISASQTFGMSGYNIAIIKEYYGENSKTLVICVHVEGSGKHSKTNQAIAEVSVEKTFNIPNGCKHILVLDKDLQPITSREL